MWEFIEAFLAEWGWQICLGLTFMLLIILVIRELYYWPRSCNKYRVELASREYSYGELHKKYEVARNILSALGFAVSGDGSSAPCLHDSSIDVFDSLFSDLSRDRRPSKEKLNSVLKLIWQLNSANQILLSAKKGSQEGDSEDHSDVVSYDVSGLEEQYLTRMGKAAGKLNLFSLSGLSDSLMRHARDTIEPVVIIGHTNQAKKLLEEMGLGTADVDMTRVNEFVEQCTAANIDPYILADEKLMSKKLSMVLDAAKKIAGQVDPPDDSDAAPKEKTE